MNLLSEISSSSFRCEDIQKPKEQSINLQIYSDPFAFVLPNDESKYYLDYPKDIENMLQLDFGKDLSGVDINISFQFFEYGNSLTARPYIDRRRKALKVEGEDIDSYFDYLSKPSISREQSDMPFLRYVVHNINGWY